ncbi:NUDIX hydrolase [Candidatus Desantisbacteria bacterium]|nr:NUDIX hydrolase [Candidatus Desantisbacteria bacterium]
MKYNNPLPTADIIIELFPSPQKGEGIIRGIVLIKRKNPPYGWAIPGGFVEYGESMEQTAVREAKEETGLDISLICQLHTYSAPDRDPRHHTITTVFVAQADGEPMADDDAADVGIFKEDNLPCDIAFDHREILADYFLLKKKGGLL